MTTEEAAGGFSYASDELDAMAGAIRYYRWIAERFAPYLGDRVVEVGAGIGTFSEHLLRAAPDATLAVVEPAGNNVPRLQARFAAEGRVRVVHGVLGGELPDGGASSIVAVNVLEHVPDDLDFMRHAARVLEPGGHLLIYVPALPALFGTLDEAFEHFRRYTRRTLRGVTERGGLRVVDLRYTNLPGVCAWWLAGRVLRRRTVTAASARLYDRAVIPWVRALESVWTPPVGQSLVMVARRAG